MAVVPAFGSIKPSQKQQVLIDNYLSFNDGTGNDFAQQYLPEIYEQYLIYYAKTHNTTSRLIPNIRRVLSAFNDFLQKIDVCLVKLRLKIWMHF